MILKKYLCDGVYCTPHPLVDDIREIKEERNAYQKYFHNTLFLLVLTVVFFSGLNFSYGNTLSSFNFSGPTAFCIKEEKPKHDLGELYQDIDPAYWYEVHEASWYNYNLNINGETVKWSKNHRTAASRDLPRYSCAKVTNVKNNKSIVVFINDYGPEEWTGRDIDLSSHAFAGLAPLSLGVIEVTIEPSQCE